MGFRDFEQNPDIPVISEQNSEIHEENEHKGLKKEHIQDILDRFNPLMNKMNENF